MASIKLGALDPDSIKVDGRDRADRLAFAADYGKLINFYDLDNQQNGDWRGFFLKDPLILLAAISRTDYKLTHRQWTQLVQKLTELLAQTSLTHQRSELICRLFNQLFSLMDSLFIVINEWLVNAKKDPQQYPLKTFIHQQVKTELRPLLHQTVALQQQLHGQYPAIARPDSQQFAYFNKDWQLGNASTGSLLPADGSAQPLAYLSLAFDSLRQHFAPLFSFYVQVIDQAGQAYDNQAQQGSHYPDTALLVAFCQLMEIQQQQLNEVSQRHLAFYYQNILKQTSAGEVADQVVLCLQLATKYPQFTLPAGTEFNAGMDGNNQPLVFASKRAQALNQALITGAQTVFYGDGPAPKPLYHQTITSPVQLDALGWPLFGEGTDEDESIAQGFAFASPMLYLQGGSRIITLTLTFAESIAIAAFKDSTAYLSSATKWLELTPAQLVYGGQGNQLVMTITLSPAVLPVVALDKKVALSQKLAGEREPSSDWPMFKLSLGELVDLTAPPQLQHIAIETQVSGFSQVDGYSDVGKLPDSGFLPFGAVAAEGDSFYLGSAELFAKPLSTLTVQLNWLNLPDDFSDYYTEYNIFLLQQYANQLTQYNQAVAAQTKAGEAATSLPPIPMPVQLSNGSFTVGFSLWESGQWQPLIAEQANISDQQTPLFRTQQSKDGQVVLMAVSYFDFAYTGNTTAAGSLFPANPALLLQPLTVPNSDHQGFLKVQLQGPVFGFGAVLYPKVVSLINYANSFQLVKYAAAVDKPVKSGKSSGGFWGALGDIAKAVFPLEGAIASAFESGDSSSSTSTTVPSPVSQLQSMPNPPYAPKVGSLSVTYTASSRVDFSVANPQNAPFEFYHDNGFCYYPVYDANESSPLDRFGLSPGVAQSAVTSTSTSTATSTSKSIPLFPGVVSGALYLTLDKVQPADELTLFFQLIPPLDNPTGLPQSPQSQAVNRTPQPTKAQIQAQWAAGVSAQALPSVIFSYLTDSGWQSLKVQHDPTRDFACSGIISVQVPDDISNNSILMPGDQYWLALSVQQQAEQFSRVVYLNTQAITATRVSSNSLKPGESMALAAGKISTTVKPQPSLARITQPFAATGGAAAEDTPAFYQRVSQRIYNKSRGGSAGDYQQLVLAAFPVIFFAQCSAGTVAGMVNVGVVKAYANAALPGAFAPVVSRCDIDRISTYLQAKSAVFVHFNVTNLLYQTVTITASLVFTEPDVNLSLCQQINQQLKLFLSPWITTNQRQSAIDEDLSKGQIIDFIIGLPTVISVQTLQIDVDNQTNCQLIKRRDGQLLVSAAQHMISQASATTTTATATTMAVTR